MELSGLSSTTMAFMVTGILIVFTIVILAKFGTMDEVTGDTDAYTAFNDTKEAITSFPEWLPIIALCVIAGIVIYIIYRSFPRGD